MSAGFERRERQAGRRRPEKPIYGEGYEPTVEEMAAFLARRLRGRRLVGIERPALPGCAGIIVHGPLRPRRLPSWGTGEEGIVMPKLEDLALAEKALARLVEQGAVRTAPLPEVRRR